MAAAPMRVVRRRRRSRCRRVTTSHSTGSGASLTNNWMPAWMSSSRSTITRPRPSFRSAARATSAAREPSACAPTRRSCARSRRSRRAFGPPSTRERPLRVGAPTTWQWPPRRRSSSPTSAARPRARVHRGGPRRPHDAPTAAPQPGATRSTRGTPLGRRRPAGSRDWPNRAPTVSSPWRRRPHRRRHRARRDWWRSASARAAWGAIEGRRVIARTLRRRPRLPRPHPHLQLDRHHS